MQHSTPDEPATENDEPGDEGDGYLTPPHGLITTATVTMFCLGTLAGVALGLAVLGIVALLDT